MACFTNWIKCYSTWVSETLNCRIKPSTKFSAAFRLIITWFSTIRFFAIILKYIEKKILSNKRKNIIHSHVEEIYDFLANKGIAHNKHKKAVRKNFF